MKHIRPSYVALAMLAGTVTAGPAYACPPCGPMTAPVSAAPPSVRPSTPPSVRPVIPSIQGAVDASNKAARDAVQSVPRTPQQYEDKLDEGMKKARKENKEKNLGLDESELASRVAKIVAERYTMQTFKEEEERVRAEREAQWRKNQADWQAVDEEKRKQAAEAERKRQAENAPPTPEEKARRGRVNRGEIPPGPGDIGQPWYSPWYSPGEKPWLNK